jgi:hypothetical protein
MSAAPAPRSLASYIDHTLLKPEATAAQVAQLCAEARDYRFYAVCVNGSRAELARHFLEETEVPRCFLFQQILISITPVVNLDIAPYIPNPVFRVNQLFMNGTGEVEIRPVGENSFLNELLSPRLHHLCTPKDFVKLIIQ